MKNAGKACNNRLYRHIRTFEKIVKNYFVIYNKSHRKAAALFNKEQLLFCGERPLRNQPHNDGVGFGDMGALGGFCLHWKLKREYGKIAVQSK